MVGPEILSASESRLHGFDDLANWLAALGDGAPAAARSAAWVRIEPRIGGDHGAGVQPQDTSISMVGPTTRRSSSHLTVLIGVSLTVPLASMVATRD